MIISKRKVKIVLIIVVIITLLQFTRLGFIVKWNNLEHETLYNYDVSESEKLNETDLINFAVHKVLIIKSEDELLNDNYMELLDYMKFEYEFISDIDLDSQILSDYDLVLCINEAWSEIAALEDIYSYVEKGGKFIVYHGFDAFFDPYYGFYSNRIGVLESGENEGIKSIVFNETVIEGVDQVSIDENEETFMRTRTVQISNECEILALDQKQNPLQWTLDYGSGKIGVINIQIDDPEIRKAFLLGMMEKVMETLVYPIVNTQVVFIDDFPGKFEGNNEKVMEAYGRNIERYLSEIWWPDIVATSKNYGIVYTSAFIAGYNDNVSGDFDKEDIIDEKDLLQYGRETMRYGGEIAFHGYNHQSLILDQTVSDIYGYNAWESREQIIDAISVAQNYFANTFPNYKWYTYVPPSNLLEEEGYQILIELLPSLEVFSGILYSNVEGTLLQKFSVDENGIVQFPRVSSGTIVTEKDLFYILSVAKNNGVVNHFLHPDDYMSNERSMNKSWEEMYDDYTYFLESVNDAYPWLEKNQAYDGGQKVEQYHYLDLYYQITDKNLLIACDNYQLNQSVIIVSDKEIISIDGGTFKKIGKNKYLVIMQKNIVNMEVQ